jgi:hypothetical protein
MPFASQNPKSTFTNSSLYGHTTFEEEPWIIQNSLPICFIMGSNYQGSNGRASSAVTTRITSGTFNADPVTFVSDGMSILPLSEKRNNEHDLHFPP